jgi:hypothetical protein
MNATMNTSRFKIAFYAIVLVPIISLSISIVLTSCGKDEPESEGSFVGQWELKNLDDLANDVQVSPYGVFSETDGIVFEFKENGTIIQYIHTHNKWYIVGKGIYWIVRRIDKKSGWINCEFSMQPVPISSFNDGSINFQYSNLTSKSLTLTGAISHPYGLKFKRTSGVTATEHFKYP